MVENLEAQTVTVLSARQFIGDVPLVISPVALKRRFNPLATAPEPEPGPGELPRPVDVRQMSLFGAAWTVGSLKYLAESGGVEDVTYYETTGWRGVMETESGSPLPDKFHSLPSAVFPLYHVLADLGEFAGGEVISTQSSDTLRVDGLAVRKDGRTRIIFANMTADPQQVTVRHVGDRAWVRCLDETNAEASMLSSEDFRAQKGKLLQTSAGALKLSLLPCAIIRIDEGGSETFPK